MCVPFLELRSVAQAFRDIDYLRKVHFLYLTELSAVAFIHWKSEAVAKSASLSSLPVLLFLYRCLRLGKRKVMFKCNHSVQPQWGLSVQ